ncbi:MAG: SIMPL domain-containing protein [bacterium]|nr:SIMPL domain-containing protein [bacterium]
MNVFRIVSTLLFVGILLPSIAQNDEPTPHIEVTGTARLDIMPDEIYVSITLREREDGKDKVSVEKQEADLKKALQELGISLDLLSLSDSESDYVKIRFRKKEVITTKSYSLKLATAQEVNKTFEKLDELNILDAYISKTERSDIVELRKQLRIDAIKAAKDKADYLLNAIGEEAGHALEVRENTNDFYRVRSMANNIQSYNFSLAETDDNDEYQEIGFERIRLEASIYVKFEIKQD